ncbi:hypothetical protein HNQ93_004396 [Hymenobacter luteus]|uniref:DUF2480 family protein n=2 Tax=Hymenobacter TaxID=89966 RepID=A0A7W9T5U9_9BACT|nr:MULTISPECIES: DUF2480 family protein [Hymenobacter]MBB4603729.1 hypothetical protein [Hymenobacter latericoloratus]MBB6061515.1 hypothetical protein [Hymenobacter luteus]
MADEVINRVAASGLVVLDLRQFQPTTPPVVVDISAFLVQGLMLREKEFRAQVLHTDWSEYTGQTVCIGCSTDALVPYWAPLFVATQLRPYAASISTLPPAEWHLQQWVANLQTTLDLASYAGKKVVLQAQATVPAELYVQAGRLLLPVVASLMCGEPGYAVPIYKQVIAGARSAKDPS